MFKRTGQDTIKERKAIHLETAAKYLTYFSGGIQDARDNGESTGRTKNAIIKLRKEAAKQAK